MHAGHVVQGGSTITQQLVRNLYLDIQDRSIKRKLAEVVLAFDVENNYPKSKILETYLNEVYFGNGVYGIERAAEVYFNKPAAKLTLGESAFIAGLIRAPSDLGARVNRDAAITRQHEVLDQMAEYKLASQSDVDAAKQQKLHFSRASNSDNQNPYPYYVATVLHTLNKTMPEDQIWSRGLRVYTNLDQNAQRDAEAMLNKGINAAPHGINQGALVCESVKDGGILALVGGVGDYRNHQFNRALAPHTVGSAFKPFVYLAAAIQGAIKPVSAIDDSPISFNMGFGKVYTPKNFDGKFLGTISVRDALALSRNVCAIRVGDAVGISHVIETARAAGITAPLDNNLTLALGSCAVSPLEMATAYATLARDGIYTAPRVIRQIDDAQGNVITKCSAISTRTLPQEQVSEIVDIMGDVVRRGTGTEAKLKNIAVAGKTGTADKARDIWFVGFTPDTVTAVWGGNDRYLPVRGNVTGGVVMGKIWHDFMVDFYHSHLAPTVAFAAPQTPFVQQASAAINSSLVNEAQQYEEGLKNPAAPDSDATSQSDQTAAPADGSVSPDENSEAMPPVAPATVPAAPVTAPAPAPAPSIERNQSQQETDSGDRLRGESEPPTRLMPAPEQPHLQPAPESAPAPAPAPTAPAPTAPAPTAPPEPQSQQDRSSSGDSVRYVDQPPAQ
jgi:penicillin-binding protein 1A